MDIITGKTGEAHISSADDGHIYASIFGTGQYVLPLGKEFSGSMESVNTLRIQSGDICMNGRVGRIRDNLYEDLTIANGVSGEKRTDLLVVRYENNDGIESMSLVVIQGTSTTGDPETPSYNSDSILDGAGVADFPLYKINLDGISVPTLTSMFTVVNSNLTNLDTSLEDYFGVDSEVQDLFDTYIS